MEITQLTVSPDLPPSCIGGCALFCFLDCDGGCLISGGIIEAGALVFGTSVETDQFYNGA